MDFLSRAARRLSHHVSPVVGNQPTSGGSVAHSDTETAVSSVPGRNAEGYPLSPRAMPAPPAPRETEPTEGEAAGGETILVLEDDPDVRELAANALKGLGYRVLVAGDANAAMRLLAAENGNVALLLSDIVLPGGLDGPSLAAKARHLFPDLRLVFMSGYAAALYTGDTVPGFTDPLLSKPFLLSDLTRTVQEALAA